MMITYTELQMEDIEDEGHNTGVGIQGNWPTNYLKVINCTNHKACVQNYAFSCMFYLSKTCRLLQAYTSIIFLVIPT